MKLERATAKSIRAFTLIEMLVVLLVMGIFVGLVSAIAQPDDRGVLRVESERLAQLLDLAATKARLTGRALAWASDGTGYRFSQFSEDSYWSDILDDDVLRARTLPKGMVISGLQIENKGVPDLMRLEFHPHGPTLAFSIEISLGAMQGKVTGSPVGQMRVSTLTANVHEILARR